MPTPEEEVSEIVVGFLAASIAALAALSSGWWRQPISDTGGAGSLAVLGIATIVFACFRTRYTRAKPSACKGRCAKP